MGEGGTGGGGGGGCSQRKEEAVSHVLLWRYKTLCTCPSAPVVSHRTPTHSPIPLTLCVICLSVLLCCVVLLTTTNITPISWC